jgi:hypothetical protein
MPRPAASMQRLSTLRKAWGLDWRSCLAMSGSSTYVSAACVGVKGGGWGHQQEERGGGGNLRCDGSAGGVLMRNLQPSGSSKLARWRRQPKLGSELGFGFTGVGSCLSLYWYVTAASKARLVTGRFLSTRLKGNMWDPALAACVRRYSVHSHNTR